MQLDPALNIAPNTISSVHLMGIGGVAMGAITAVRAVHGPDSSAQPQVNGGWASGRARAAGRAVLARRHPDPTAEADPCS
ncbi:MAG: hypothetical protein V1806_09240 [Pseudomonadota bacterium]